MDIDPIRPATLSELAAVAGTHCLSIFMPTHSTGAESRQDPIRLQNLLDAAAEQLKSRGLRRSEIESLLKPASEVVSQANFWQHQGAALAIYLTEGTARMLRLPERLDESVTIGPHFNIKPLLGAVSSSDPFYVLSLTEKDARLYRGSRNELVELEEGGFPVSATDVVAARDTEEQLQHQSFRDPSQGRGDTMAGVFHGHGEGEQKLESDDVHFLKEVAQRLAKYLYEDETPLILAADERIAGMYRAEHYRGQLLDAAIHGSPAHMPVHQLREQAWEIARPVLQADRSKLLDRYGTSASASKAAEGFTDVVVAAATGKVDTLFFDPRACQPGRLTDGGASASVADGAADGTPADPDVEDLVNRAVIETIRCSGRVVPLPAEAGTDPQPPKAILRY